jgi:hypothetical protein
LKLKEKKIGKLQECFGVEKSIAPEMMLGLEIEVYWNQPSSRGWWSGSITDNNPLSGNFLVKYETSSKDGKDTYKEKLLSNTIPQ